jgi:hypothetical protein
MLLAGSTLTISGASGCSSAPAESARNGDEAYTYTKSVSLTAGQFNLLVQAYVQPQNAGFSASNNLAVFEPSQGMRQLGFPAQITVTIPTESVTIPLCGPTKFTVPNLWLSQPPSITLDANGIEVDAAISGQVLANAWVPLCNSTFNLNDVPVHATLITSGGNVVAHDASIGLVGHVSASCGITGWCPPLVSGYIASAQADIGNLLVETLNDQLQNPALQHGLDGAVVGEEAKILGLSGVQMVPGSLFIANATVGNSLTYVAAPPLMHCTGAPTCAGSNYTTTSFVDFTCDPLAMVGGFDLLLQRQVAGTSNLWQTVATTNVQTPGFGATLEDTIVTTGTQQTLTYRTCTSDSGGTTCGSPFTVESEATCLCQPYFACGDPAAQCGTILNDGRGHRLDCGTCAAGSTCSSNRCCPDGTGWSEVDGRCEANPLNCKPGWVICPGGGSCCRCSGTRCQ